MRTAFFLLVGAICTGCASAPVAPADPVPVGSTTVTMTADGFSPETLTVEKGTSVCFENKHEGEARWPASDNHPTHEIYPEFDPHTPVREGAHWCFVFLKPGNWKYHDHLLPDFRGTVVVR